MTTKEKAIQLVNIYSVKASECSEETEFDYDKQCALICIDELINTGINQDYIKQDGYMLSLVEFYTEVKQEIEKL